MDASRFDLPTTVNLASGIAAVVALVVSIFEIHQSRSQARRTATFEHIRHALDVARAGARDLTPAQAQAEVLRCLEQNVPLTAAANQYLHFLDELDILAFAYQHKSVDQRMVREYFRSHLEESLYPPRFREEHRRLAGDERAYEHLEKLIANLSSAPRHERIRRQFSRTPRPAEGPRQPARLPGAAPEPQAATGAGGSAARLSSATAVNEPLAPSASPTPAVPRRSTRS
jgi:hypothetical protein